MPRVFVSLDPSKCIGQGCTYPGLWWNDGLGNDFEVVQVENVLDRRTSGECNLPLLLLLGNLLDNLRNCAGIDDTDTGINEFRAGAKPSHEPNTYCFSTGRLVVMASGG